MRENADKIVESKKSAEKLGRNLRIIRNIFQCKKIQVQKIYKENSLLRVKTQKAVFVCKNVFAVFSNCFHAQFYAFSNNENKKTVDVN